MSGPTGEVDLLLNLANTFDLIRTSLEAVRTHFGMIRSIF